MNLIKKNYLFFCQAIKYGLMLCKLLLFFLITLLLLPLYFFGKFSKSFLKFKSIDIVIKTFWSRLGLWFCDVRVEIYGRIDKNADAFACNHVSWLDILVIQSISDVAFVAKSEVKRWPLFGFLAKIADTVFIDRRIMAAKAQQFDLLKSIQKRKKLFFFPEGTSTDGSHILPFKSSLFEVFITLNKIDGSSALVQPVALKYYHSSTEAPNIFGWWGDMSLLLHIFNVVANARSGKVEVRFEESIGACKTGDRKTLALTVEAAIRKHF